MGDDGLLKEEMERLYVQYGDQAKGFRRGLFVLIFAALSVFSLIVVPFLTFRDQVSALQTKEADLMAGLAAARGQVDARTKAAEAIQVARAQLFEFSNDIVSFESFTDLRDSAEAQEEELRQLKLERRLDRHRTSGLGIG